MATLVAYNHRLGSVPLEDLFPGFQFSELRTIYVRLREGPLERQDVAMSVRVCKVDRFVELIREPQLVSDGYVTAVCLGEVSLPEDGQECSSLIGRHDQLLAKIKEAGQFAAENRAPGGSRQHVRRLEAAAKYLRGMRGLQPGLLTLTENPVFRVSIAEFLGNEDRPVEQVNLATWIISVPQGQTGFLRMGGMRASPRQMVTVLLGQLQRKLQQTVRENEDVRGPFPAVIRDVVKPKRSGVNVTRMLLVGEDRNRDWKYKMIWVCSTQQVWAWIAAPEAGLYGRGTVHYVSNVGNFRQDQVSVQPVVDLDAGTQVVVVILADIHEFIHMHEALVRLRPMLEDDVGGLAGTSIEGLDGLLKANAFNAWLGLSQPMEFVPSPVWDRYLGSQREVFLREAAVCLGIGSFSADQRRVLSGINGTVTVVSSFAGGGKTTLLAAVTVQLARYLEPPLVVFNAPALKTVQSFAKRLEKVGLNVLVLGVEKEDQVDLFEEKCAAVAAEVFERHRQFYEAVDELLELVPADRLDVRSIVLGWRFIHLQNVVYDAMRVEQQRELDAVQFVACTTSYMSKMNGNGGWEKRFRGRRRFGCNKQDRVVAS